MVDRNSSEEAIESRVPPSSEILNLIAKEVPVEEIRSIEIQSLIDKMLRIARGRQGDSRYPTMVGLAAPQIGVSKRVVLIGMNAIGAGEQPELKAFINPKLVYTSDETEEDREGCFSTSRVCGVVERAKMVIISAYDKDGDEFQTELVGFPARVAQHEIDHLNGIRFPDRITDDSKLHWVEESEFGNYRSDWASWTILCSREKWKQIKAGE